MSSYDHHTLAPGLNMLWPTPVLLHKLPAGATDDIATEFMMTDKLDLHAGEKTGADRMANPTPTIAKFRDEHIVPSFEKYMNEVFNDTLTNYELRMKGWLTGSGINYGMPPHGHSGSQLTAVFYVLAEEDHAGGEIGLIDPRGNACRGYEGVMREQFFNYQHLPKTGDVLIMPSFLYHYVVIYHARLRLAFPVDLFLQKY